MKIKMTKKQLEALLHRLEEPDCIAEALTDRFPDSPASAWTYEQVYDVAESLWRDSNGTVLDCTRADTISDGLPKDQMHIHYKSDKTFALGLTDAVLIDAIDGSTYVACCGYADNPTAAANGAFRSLDAAADILTKARGWAERPDVPKA